MWRGSGEINKTAIVQVIDRFVQVCGEDDWETGRDCWAC